MPSDSDLLLGKLAVSRGFCAQESIDWCLSIQSGTRERLPLGRLLVNEGYLTEEQHSELLALQRKNLIHVDPLTKTRREALLFGKLAVREGLLTAQQANECLALQASKNENRTLGEIMVLKGYLTPAQVDALLSKQQKRIMACLACNLKFTVFSISQGRKTIACPKCKGSLVEGTSSESPRTDAEFSTQVFRATRLELPPESKKDSRTIPRNAALLTTKCVVCDKVMKAPLDSTGRLRCPNCKSTFVPGK